MHFNIISLPIGNWYYLMLFARYILLSVPVFFFGARRADNFFFDSEAKMNCTRLK